MVINYFPGEGTLWNTVCNIEWRPTHMYIKNLAIAGSLVVASTGALANNVDNLIAVDNGTNFFGAVHSDNDPFTDTFTFTGVSGQVFADVSLVTIGSTALQNINFLTASLNGNALTLSPTGQIETGSLANTSVTGPLVLTVTGTSGAAGGTFASYSGTINVSAIPEPGTWAMLLAGLTGMGFVARRRLYS